MAACLCRTCGERFGGVTGFDRHLRLLDRPPWTACMPPANQGLKLVAGVWRQDAPHLA